MMNKTTQILSTITLCLALVGCSGGSITRTEPIVIIPQPTKITELDQKLYTQTGKPEITIDTTLATGAESYTLVTSDGRAKITAAGEAGAFYAMQTLQQLDQNGRIPNVEITDAPQFAWRGVMFDVSRHYQSPEYIKELLDMLAYHKINTLHWHLTDGVGWRLQIDKYPLLTQRGAWRKVSDESVPWIGFELSEEGTPGAYGGYYTKQQVRDIVEYAAQRHITVVPEIEMPGHSDAATTCYPQYSCQGANPRAGVYCAGNDSTFAFLEGIIDEVVELFPAEYIHIGGDEVGKEQWKACPRCQARMKAEGLKDEHELQSYFVKRMENYIRSKGKRMIGWDEIAEGGLSASATVMSWTGMENGIKAANTDHDVIMCPLDYVYLDHYQGYNPFEPQGWGGYNSLHRVYDFPVLPEGIAPDKQHYVKGGQGNLWTETIQDTAHIEYMLFPRMSALSEVLWSAPTERNWEQFVRKVDHQVDRYTQRGWNYSQSAMTPMVMSQSALPEGKISIKLDTEMGIHPIRYTTDGTHPTITSPLYSDSIVISNPCDLRASAFRRDSIVGYMLTVPMLLNKAYDATVTYKTPCGAGYFGGGAKGLVDNRYAIKRGDDKPWQGFEAKDMDVVLDMQQTKTLKGATLRFFQHTSTTSVMLPEWISISLSDNGRTFREVATQQIPTVNDYNAFIESYNVDFPEQAARYVKIKAKNRGKIPTGLPRGGASAWIFTDEIALY